MQTIATRDAASEEMPRQMTVVRKQAAVVRPAGPRPADLSISVHDSLASAEAAWRMLEALPGCSIHHTFDWCRHWVEATGASPRIVVGCLGGKPAFLLPLEISRLGGPGLTGASVARFIASQHSNLAFGPFSAAFLDAATPELLASLAEKLIDAMPGADLLALEKMPGSSQGLANPFLHFAHIENQNRAFQITLHADFEDVLAQINRKRRRKKFKNAVKGLNDLGGYSVVKGDTPERAEWLLSTFFDQKKRRFAALGIADSFAAPETQAFLMRVARDSIGRERQMLRLHGLLLHRPEGDALCAVAGVSLMDGYATCQFGSIDEALAPGVSVGDLLFHHIIESLCVPGARTFDFGIGDQPYKRSWCDIERVHYDAYVPLTAKGRAVSSLLKTATRGKAFVKSRPRLERLARQVQMRLSRRQAR